MSNYRTIAVYLADEACAGETLGVACRLGQADSAHVVGITMDLPDVVTPPLAMGRAIVAESHAAMRRRAAELETRFNVATSALGVVGEWRFVRPGRTSVTDALLKHVRAADLIVASQGRTGWEADILMEQTEDVLMQSGRPVLVVPRTGSFPSLATRVVVAWGPRKEAARAVFDALPLLRRADAVEVVQVEPDAGGGDTDALDAVVASLTRHGVRCIGSTKRGADGDVGRVLLDHVADLQASLLVMGGYGRWRWREMVLGGATRHVLQTMTVPVLMSH